MAEVTFTDANFDAEVKNYKDGPVLVDFFAPWCGPCQMMAPIIAELANEVGDGIKVGKMNVDDNQAKAQEFGVMSIPTIIIFKDGEAKETLVGVQDKDSLKQKLEALK
ncbi:thioredoxin [Candidatus Falkowbacteria bacterium CG10_big_fil_rev_8_21_14_0_10_39_11]|uniref:Thioredoxin n=1 Tax=Candidatus Falkowbacteria bacterium CG10_big_fil_rev_8_21_14_0_10_39_11 TaxID=1974565 RepID=A0A2H0V4N6_9BACT|nr:MAG: thioredoxin [Candidatus Falkowbacteria bacterium CG10_big_fil_rev_8_21_14_0_10_39_11]